MVLKSKSNIYNNNLLKSFDENGYIILDVIDKKKLNEVKKDLHIMILDSLKSNASEFVSKNKKKLKNKNFILNEGLIYLEKKNHKFLSKIYDVIAKTTSFLNLICDERIVKLINYLLRRKKNSNLYINSNSIRMDMPNDKEFYYGWHRDNNTNIKIQIFYNYGCPSSLI